VTSVPPPSGRVTFLFTDIEGSTTLWDEQPDAMGPALEQHDGIIHEQIAAHDGHVVKTTGDGFHAVFADPGRAVAAAVAAQRALAAAAWGPTGPLAVRMGIHTGDATVRDGDYYGSATNRAARLMAIAHGGQIVVSESTAGGSPPAVRGEIRMVDLGEHRLRGLATPERVFQAVVPDLPSAFPPLMSVEHSWEVVLAELDVPLPARLTRPTQFVGREADGAALRKAWADARGGGDALVVVTGEPGVGKTVLVADLAREAHHRGEVVLFGRCDEDVAVAFGPFTEALGALVATLPRQVLTEHLETYGPHLARLVPGLRPLVRAGAAESGDQLELFVSVTELLDRVGAVRPVLLAIDDIQWVDDSTVSLLRFLLARSDPARLAVVATCRDSQVHRGSQPGEAMTRLGDTGVRIPLDGLDEEAVLAWLQAAAGHELEAEARDLAVALRRDTGGNPFFLAQVLQQMGETGVLFQEGGRWQLQGDVASLMLPDSARQVVSDRVARLGEETVRVLRAAAVVGQEFDLELLAACLDESEDDVLDQLEQAERAALVHNAEGERFFFRHALVQQTLYGEMSPARRTRAHLRTVDALERLGDADTRPGEAAYHLEQSGRAEALVRAIDYHRRAGTMAVASFAPEDGVRHFSAARALADRTDASVIERCEIDVELGNAMRHAGDAAHREVLLEAARTAERLGASDVLVRAALANSRNWASHAGAVDEEKVAVLEAALRAIGPGATAERARILALLATEQTYHLPFAERRALGEEALAIARQLGDPETLSGVVTNLVNSVRAPHVLAERRALTAEHLELALAQGDRMDQWLAAMEHLQVCVEAADLQAADDALALEMDLAREIRQPYVRWLTTLHRSMRALIAGDLDHSEALRSEGLQIGLDAGQPDALMLTGAQAFAVETWRGRLPEMVELGEMVADSNPGIPGWRGALACIYCAAGRDDAARGVVRWAADIGFDQFNLDGSWMSGLVLYAIAVAHVQERDAAAQIYRLIEPFGDQIASSGADAHGSGAFALGRLATTLGDDGAADTWFAQADALEGAFGARLFQARTRAYWAELRLERGDRSGARELAEQALVTATELDCPPVRVIATRVLDA